MINDSNLNEYHRRWILFFPHLKIEVQAPPPSQQIRLRIAMIQKPVRPSALREFHPMRSQLSATTLTPTMLLKRLTIFFNASDWAFICSAAAALSSAPAAVPCDTCSICERALRT